MGFSKCEKSFVGIFIFSSMFKIRYFYFSSLFKISYFYFFLVCLRSDTFIFSSLFKIRYFYFDKKKTHDTYYNNIYIVLFNFSQLI